MRCKNCKRVITQYMNIVQVGKKQYCSFCSQELKEKLLKKIKVKK